MQYVGIDLSLTSTGLAIYRAEDVVPGGLAMTRCITSKPGNDRGHTARLRRFQRISNEISSEIGSDDAHVFLEGPSYGSTGSAVHDIAGNWWLLYQTLNDDGMQICVVPPAVVKMYATGKGNASKDAVMAAAIKRYPEINIPGNDIADAVILMAIGCRFNGIPLEDSLPATHLRALDKLRAA